MAAAGQAACSSPALTKAQLQTLDQGGTLTAGGLPSNKSIPRQGNGSYGATLYSTGLLGSGATGNPTLTAGIYTMSGGCGSGVRDFSASVTMPGDFAWPNQSSVPNPIPRASPLTVTWTGGAGGLVTILGAALTRISGTGLTATYSAIGFT